MRPSEGIWWLARGLLPVWLLLFTLIPMMMVLVVSVLTRDETRFIDPIITLENYRRLLDPVYLRVFTDSVVMAGLSTVACLCLAYPFAYLLSRVTPVWRPVLLTLVIVPFWTNSLVRIYAIRSLLAAKGALNSVLLALGWIDEPVRLLYTGWAVGLGLIYVLLPFMILPLYSIFEKLDRRLLEAAADLGAGRWAIFRHVILPLSAPGIAAGCLLVFLPALGLFYVTDILGGAHNLMIGALLKDQFLEARDWPFGSAASLIMILLLFVLMGIGGLTQLLAGSGQMDDV